VLSGSKLPAMIVRMVTHISRTSTIDAITPKSARTRSRRGPTRSRR
jgi:hypothetical protein